MADRDTAPLWMTPGDMMSASRMFHSRNYDELADALSDGELPSRQPASGVLVYVVALPARSSGSPDRTA
jgi:hypothetical protein